MFLYAMYTMQKLNSSEVTTPKIPKNR